MKSGSLLSSAATDTLGTVQKELPVAKGCFRILVDRDDDRLNVGIAPSFARRPVSNLSQGLHPWRVVRILVVPFERARSPWTTSQGFALHRPLLFLEPVPFGPELVDPL